MFSLYFATVAKKMGAFSRVPGSRFSSGKASTLGELAGLIEENSRTRQTATRHRRRCAKRDTVTLIVNQVRGTFRKCAIGVHGFGDRRKAMPRDLAILTRAQSGEIAASGLTRQRSGTSRQGTSVF